jgi:subtilisin-like proprotein convertase family protein/streptogramin lyase
MAGHSRYGGFPTMFAPLVRKVFSAARQTPYRKSKSKSPCRLAVESLEDRCVPTALAIAGQATVAEGVLYTLHLFSQDPTLTSWTIQWGDGATDVIPSSATTASHVYAVGPTLRNISASGVMQGGTVAAEAHVGGGELLGTAASGLGASQGMTVGPDGSLYVVSSDDILRYDSNGSFMGVFVDNAGSTVWSMTFGPDGKLYWTSRNDNQVRRFDGGTIDVFATADSPVGVAFGPDANFNGAADLYVLSRYTDQVLVHDGATGSFIQSLSGGISDPFNLAISPDGGIYVADYGAGTVVRYNATTSTFDTFASGVGSELTDLEFDSTGNLLYVVSRADDRVLRFNGQTGAFMDALVDRGDDLAGPNQIALDSDGNLFVSNWGTGNVLRFTGPTPGQNSLPVIVLDVVTTTYTNNTSVNIPDGKNNPFGSPSPIVGIANSTINVPHTNTILDINLTLNISHTYVSDLRAVLWAPSGRSTVLFSRIGGRGDNFTNTTFDDEAAASIQGGTPPYAGSFTPTSPLFVHDATSTNGAWRLEIGDHASGVKGKLNSWSLTITRGIAPSSLIAASTPAAPDTQPSIDSSALAPVLQEAIARWQAVGLASDQLRLLNNVDVQIADLGGATLGLAAGNTIWLDDNAAGWGWFVDPTPWDDSEFLTPGDQGEQNRMDLLTVLEHELGHLLGFDHEEGGVMDDTLAAGTRATQPTIEDAVIADGLFADEKSPLRRKVS